MPKMTVKAFKEKIQETLNKAKNGKEEVPPVLRVRSLEIVNRVQELLNKLSDAEAEFTREEAEPFYNFFKEQVGLQDTPAGYFQQPNLLGNKVCFMLAQHLAIHDDRLFAQVVLPLLEFKSGKAADKFNKKFIEHVKAPDQLRRYILSADGKHLIDVAQCLENARERKEASLHYPGLKTPLSDLDLKRVIGHSELSKTAYENLKLHAFAYTRPEIHKYDEVIKTTIATMNEQIKSAVYQSLSIYGKEGDKKVVDAILSTIKTRADLASLLTRLPFDLWSAFLNEIPSQDLYKLILDGCKSVDALIDVESKKISSDKAFDCANKFLASVAYGIEKTSQSKMGWMATFTSAVVSSEYTNLYPKETKEAANTLIQQFLARPVDEIDPSKLGEFIQKKAATKIKPGVYDSTYVTGIGVHTLGKLAGWITGQYPAPVVSHEVGNDSPPLQDKLKQDGVNPDQAPLIEVQAGAGGPRM